MDIQHATEILELEMIDIVNKLHVKKQFHRLALQYHPDKNGNSAESTEKFKQINEAYNYLKTATDYPTTKQSHNTSTTYGDLLGLFIQSVLSRTNESFVNIVKTIIGGGPTMAMFEECDKTIVVEVYEFLCKYKQVLHVSSETLAEIKRIVIEKCKNDQIYILNPILKDLFEGNLYKLVVDEKVYYVPLWNSESYFDNGAGGEIVVRCVPELPDNVSIDENNNIGISVSIKLTNDLLERSCIDVPIYCDKYVSVKVCDLKLVKQQSITFRQEGIFRINEHNNSIRELKKTDIVIFMTLV
jgi:DnaJ-class molecular chaperone